MWGEQVENDDDAEICLPLLAALNENQAHDDGSLLAVVSAHAAPLAVLRNTVHCWREQHPAESGPCLAAEQVLLLFTPANVADSLRPARSRYAPDTMSPPRWTALGAVARVSSGRLVSYCVPDPPHVDFSFPFTQAVPPAVAASTVEWCREAVDVITRAAKDARQHRIEIRLSPKARQVLGVAHLWLEQTSLPTVSVSP